MNKIGAKSLCGSRIGAGLRRDRPESLTHSSEETNMLRFKTMLCAAAVVAAMTGTASAQMADGTYTGIGQGRNGELAVEVTVKAGKLDAVKVVRHVETPGVSDAAVANFPAAIVAAQSTAVDSVTGASLTSEGIRTAVADAIRKAGGDPAQFATVVAKKKAAKKPKKAEEEEIDLDDMNLDEIPEIDE